MVNEPVSGTVIVTGVGTASLLSYWTSIHPSVIIGAFAGAAVYVLSSSDISLYRKACFFILSFSMGIIGAEYAAKVISSMTSFVTHSTIEVDASIGALAASAVSIKMVLSLISKADIPSKTSSGGKDDSSN